MYLDMILKMGWNVKLQYKVNSNRKRIEANKVSVGFYAWPYMYLLYYYFYTVMELIRYFSL